MLFRSELPDIVAGKIGKDELCGMGLKSVEREAQSAKKDSEKYGQTVDPFII